MAAREESPVTKGEEKLCAECENVFLHKIRIRREAAASAEIAKGVSVDQ